MAIDFIPTRVGHPPSAALDQLIARIREQADAQLRLGEGILYYGWPKYTDYEAVRHYVDLALISSRVGLLFIRVLPATNPKHLIEVTESISQSAAAAVSQLIRSPALRTRGNQLKIPVISIIYAPGYDGLPVPDVEFFNSETGLLRFIGSLEDVNLRQTEYDETRSIIEGAKALVRSTRRVISDPRKQQLAEAMASLEDEIASFDQRQRQVALTALDGPHRIRGLAGSGKTVILAMKAALAHLDNPDAKILVTFYTRSLRDHLTRLITRFHRDFGDGDPNWKQIHIRHGWGRKDLPGAYREACIRADVPPLSFIDAQARAARGQEPFDYACRQLIASNRIVPYYDLVLIDEGQDFPSGFYEMCFFMAKGERDAKHIVWAYDELQNIFDVKVRTPEELFGTDVDGEPRIKLSRALPAHAETNDFVLPKCYRNQRDVLVLAHASGFGLYGQPVQMLQDRAHWEDVGYEVESDSMEPGTTVVINRPDKNSPTRLNTPARIPLVEVNAFQSIESEVSYCADQFRRFVNEGLQPEDLMAIAVDDRAAQRYLSLLATELAARDIPSNNIIADRYSEPPFLIEGKCTLSTVHRAKGNEAAVVAVLGCDAIALESRSGRNRLFTAFTRTKGWLRISGMRIEGRSFDRLSRELDIALRLTPKMQFTMPDPRRIEMIQRDLSEKDARIQRARAEMERLKEEYGLSDDDFDEVVGTRKRHGRS